MPHQFQNSRDDRDRVGLASAPPSPDEIARFAAIVGDRHALTDDADRAAHDAEQRRAFPGRSALVLRPGSADEVAGIVSLAAALRRPIVPQGGNTGLVGGGIARGDASPLPPGSRETGSGLDIVVSLGRLDRIRDVDPAGNTMVVEAGCVLDRVRDAADEADRLFPLALASGGSAQIGGLISSNAGGTAVLAYGNTRDLVLGIEAVTPDGRLWNGLSRLHKNNTGYDLKHMFIGGEGTLGIVTAAVLRLHPKPKGRALAFVGATDPHAALRVFERLRATAGPQLTMFELMSRRTLDMVVRHTDHREPFATPHDWYALIEVSSGRSADEANALAEEALGAAIEAGDAADAVLATSLAQEGEFRGLREQCSAAQRREGASIKHDISVPVHAIPDFIERAEGVVQGVVPGARVVCFGHMGDGNLHYNVSQPADWDAEAFRARTKALNDAVFELVIGMEGSISAEHGIGQQKRDRLPAVKPAVEMEMMRAVKRALDPRGIMNPGKLL